MWSRFSSEALQRRHDGETFIPHCCSLSFVGNLLRIATHERKACLGILVLNQIVLCQGTAGGAGYKVSHVFEAANWPGSEAGLFRHRKTSGRSGDRDGGLLGKQALMSWVILWRPLGKSQESPEIASETLAVMEMPRTRGPFSPDMVIKGPRPVQLSCQKRAWEPEWIWQKTKGRATDLNFINWRQIEDPDWSKFASQKIPSAMMCSFIQATQRDPVTQRALVWLLFIKLLLYFISFRSTVDTKDILG